MEYATSNLFCRRIIHHLLIGVLSLFNTALADQLPAYNVTNPAVEDTFFIGDTLHIQWEANTELVYEAYIYISSDSGVNWSEIPDTSVTLLDAEWLDYPWIISDSVGGERIAGKWCRLRICNYARTLCALSPYFLFIDFKDNSRIRNKNRTGKAYLKSASRNMFIYGLDGRVRKTDLISTHLLHNLKLSGYPCSYYICKADSNTGYFMLNLIH
ncbi:MAG: hypothetical protein GF401_08535 [Chitinivibrionales bacterium]|nr:hypothetical protein [Chitinivibrionales bacterium]